MEDNQIIDKLISVLDAEDMWFTQKTDPTFGEAPDYFKLNEYGDLTDASAKKIVKEITSLIGDGAVDIEDAINLWLQDAMADNKVGYRDMLVTKFKDKPVVDGIEAYKNPVQLSEGKSVKMESIYDLDKNAEIKKGKCPYCGSTNLEYEDDAREPRVVEYDDYVSYGWHCKDCGKDGQEIFGMEFIGHDLYRDDENDSQTDFIGKTESKEIKQEGRHLVCISQLQQDTLDKVIKMCDAGMSFEDVWFKMQEDGYYLKCYNRNHKRGSDMPTRGMLYKNDEFSLVTIINGRNGKCSWETEGPVYYDENKKVSDNIKDKKEENAKRRLKEENNKSANLISQMMQEKGFDAESNAGKIILRTSALFNALSEKGYDVQVAFDNGESTSAVLLGEQGGQVLVTITDAQQQLKSFASGNFEVNDDNIAILNNVADIVKTV